MKDIKGYEGKYAITSCGKVWSYKRQRFLTPRITAFGYSRVALYNNGKAKDYMIHRLVAEAYLDNPNDLPQVNHKDENKQNNNINNLEWITAGDNMSYGTRAIRQAKALEKPIYCIELNREFESAKQASEILGLWATHITKCCKGKAKTTGGYHFKYIGDEIL